MDRFEGRTVIVTGGGSGIGRATVVRLLAEGADVVATDVVAARLDELNRQYGSDRLVTVTGDVTAASTVDALLTAVGGKVDALANVAGIMDGFLPPSEVDDGTWDRVL
ncbi:MAG: SDR family oxidoreductase, partial [Actinobacteria bacterium]|nr:SDR family oxidoreductase [Actinomycetota bacterium]